MLSIGLLMTSLLTIGVGYSLVLLWNWVPEKPPTKPLLPPSLDYIHFISCKILWGCFTAIFSVALPSMMAGFSIFATFDPMWSLLKIIRRSVLVCVASTSRFLYAFSMAITAWGSVLNLFRPVGQAASSVLVRVGFIPPFRIAAESLSENRFAQRIFRRCEWPFVTLCIAYSFAGAVKRLSFLSGYALLLSFVLAIVAPIALVGLWIPTTALHDFTSLPLILRLFFTFGLISMSILSGVIFVEILYSAEQPDAS